MYYCFRKLGICDRGYVPAFHVYIVAELGLPNNRIFLFMLVIERSLYFASLANCDGVSLFMLLFMCTITLRCQGFRFRAILQQFS